MNKYILLLRGINLGNKNKVIMSQLKESLTNEGFYLVITYINTGNIFFDSEDALERVREKLIQFFGRYYPFIESFALFYQADLLKESARLPSWWQNSFARKDVIFYSHEVDKEQVETWLSILNLHPDEQVYVGDVALFWAKKDESSFLKTTYHKHLLKAPFYKAITIRNGNTFEKILEYCTN